MEQQSNVSHNLDERKVLATERAQITRERKELEASIKRHAERMSKVPPLDSIIIINPVIYTRRERFVLVQTNLIL